MNTYFVQNTHSHLLELKNIYKITFCSYIANINFFIQFFIVCALNVLVANALLKIMRSNMFFTLQKYLNNLPSLALDIRQNDYNRKCRWYFWWYYAFNYRNAFFILLRFKVIWQEERKHIILNWASFSYNKWID